MNRVVDYGSKLKSYQQNNLYAPPSQQASGAATDYTKQLLGAMNPTAAAAPSYSQYSFQSDPAYQQAQALGSQSVADATASASAARQQALLGYGYNDSLSPLFGGDQNLIDAARGNSFSYLSNLQHQYDQGNTDSARQYTDQRAALLDALNKQNLTFGSTSDNATGDLLKNYTTAQTEGARNYQSTLSQGASGLQQLLGQINGGVLQAQQNANQQELDAAQAAAQRALLEKLLYGTGGDPTLDPTANSSLDYTGDRTLWNQTHYGSGRFGGI